MTNAHSSSDSNATIAILPQKFALVLGITAAVIYCILGTFAIFRSASSTAGIGFIILPFQAVIILVVFAFIGFWLGVIAQGVCDKQYRYKLKFYLAFIILIPALYFSTTWGAELFSTYREVTRIGDMNTQELEQAYLNRPKHSLYGYDIFILAAIAQNPNTSSDVLDDIAHLNDPRINDTIGSVINLTRENRKGLAVIRLVEKNPNVSMKTLAYLTDSNNYSLLGDLAGNPKLSQELLRKLYARAPNSEEGYTIYWGLAYNASTPPDILRELAKKIQRDRSFDPINSGLTNNPSTPDDVKQLLFK